MYLSNSVIALIEFTFFFLVYSMKVLKANLCFMTRMSEIIYLGRVFIMDERWVRHSLAVWL